jgi:hypothetical protein
MPSSVGAGVQLAPIVGLESPLEVDADTKTEPELERESNDKDEDEDAALLKFGASTSPNPSPKGASPLPPTPDLDLGRTRNATVSDEDLAAVSRRHASIYHGSFAWTGTSRVLTPEMRCQFANAVLTRAAGKSCCH